MNGKIKFHGYSLLYGKSTTQEQIVNWIISQVKTSLQMNKEKIKEIKRNQKLPLL